MTLVGGPRLGRSLVKDEFPDEVRYHSIRPAIHISVITPTNTLVPDIYGGFNLENIDSVGGRVMAAADYVKVPASFDMDNNKPILKHSTVATIPTNIIPY
ncbi:MAG: hypothetical protein M3Y53_03790 [Thermoproteota archaeon]|nr:hypothetical protein [Thermoproteota archaeon]